MYFWKLSNGNTNMPIDSLGYALGYAEEFIYGRFSLHQMILDCTQYM